MLRLIQLLFGSHSTFFLPFLLQYVSVSDHNWTFPFFAFFDTLFILQLQLDGGSDEKGREQRHARDTTALALYAEIAFLFKWKAYVGVVGLSAAATAINRPIWLSYPTYGGVDFYSPALNRVVHPVHSSAEEIESLYDSRESGGVVRVLFLQAGGVNPTKPFVPDHFNSVFLV